MASIAIAEPFDTAAKFLAALRPGDSRWAYSGDGLDFPWVFRGHGDAEWALSPNLFRRSAEGRFAGLWSDALRAVKDRRVLRGVPEDQHARVSQLYCWRYLEHALLMSFERHCHLTGLSLPEKVLGHLQVLGRNPQGPIGFESSSGPVLANKLNVIAQHHGVPTRLLDFTGDARVAALFAARDCERERLEPAEIAVWAVRRGGAQLGRVAWLEPERHVDRNVHAQAGVLAYDLEIERHYLKTGAWPSMEEPLVDDLGASSVLKLTLPNAEVPTLLDLLAREQLTWAHLMPGYDGCGTAVMLKHEWFPTHCRSCTCSKVTA